MEGKNISMEMVSSKDIAIVGMAGRFPLADGIEEFWSNIKNKVDGVRKIPNGRRRDIEDYLSFKGIDPEGVAFCNAGYLEKIDEFDYEFFDISPREAGLMDPNQRLFLETAWAAIEDAGYPENKIRGSNVGVYVGFVGESQYINLIEDCQPSFLSISVTGNCTPIVASRISYILDLKGPNMVINTSCSSSLVAIHLACKSILAGECEAAIAGGVQTHTIPIRKVTIGIESSDGRSKSFDDNSNGTGLGEGVGAIFLKPLNKALRDRDNIYAVIKGSAANQDGSSIGISAPNPVAQEEVIIKAWRDADINPETVTYIETHGTGTKLGDPVEINGITRAFANFTDRKQFCAIGAVKSNIGHLDSAAGIAGFIKAVLALKNKKLPPSIHFENPNRNINFCNSPIYYNDRLRKWDIQQPPRRCGVSSFGISGTNCHIILEEAPREKAAKVKQSTEMKYMVLTISARSKKSLKKLVKEYITFLKIQEESSLRNICYTSNIVKGQYSHRLAVVADDIDSMVKKLEIVNAKGIDSYKTNGVYYGCVDNAEKLIEALDADIKDYSKRSMVAENILENIILHYCRGYDVDWEALYDNNRKKVSLPQYTFERKRCWIEVPQHTKYKADNCNINNSDRVKNDIDIIIKKEKTLEASEIESKIGKILTEVLGHKDIDNLDNFFTMGGDSIYALAVVNLASKEFEIDITIREFMEKPTIRDFAQKVVEKLQSKTSGKKLMEKIERADEKEYYPVSSAQKRMYVLKELKDQNTGYNITSAMKIKGNLDIQRLEEALKKLIQRHESLRTSFQIIEGEIVQKINPEVNFSLKYIEGNENLDIDTAVKNLIEPFNLNKAPLFKVNIVKMPNNSYILVTDMHHIISDGTSANILIRDLIYLYDNRQLKKNPLQYRDFSQWQNRLMETDYIKSQEDYWLNKFINKTSVQDIPTDFPRHENLSFKGETLYYEIDKALNNSLLKLTMETETTMFMVLFAAYNVLLYRYTGNTDIIVGIAVSGRSHADLDDTVGMFVNTLPLINHIKGEDTFIGFLADVKKNTLEAYSNQEFPFDMLVEKLNLKGNSDKNPLFNTMFIMQNTKKANVKLEDIEIYPYKVKEEVCKFDIMMNCFEEESRINFGINYCVELFKHETIKKFWADYITILRNVTKNPSTKVSNICLDKDILIPKYNAVDVEFKLS
ncbi:condensation domain-containing protein [Alkaliphilus peptidifermentans]|uniref:Phosphopantetheine attachment site n=1 Tax=Alkaliphilus peptidifermentans DSM 18978 TaxID=1120976 RepID=A0A1G5K6T5_9FIRM|nr:condensation domain-containing protein [Alkaliphilus peptidifermentans]SCY96174.1 Phosphopantetheine attachment site [Alkaliphilus peptidifermentans DSM 18978]